MRTLWVVAIALGGAMCPRADARAQEMDAPVAIQIPVLLKVMAFDRQLPLRAPAEIVIGVVFQSGNRTSAMAKDEALHAFVGAREGVGGVPLRAVAIDLDRERLPDVLRAGKFTMLYITPLRGADVAAIASLTREWRVTTLTGVPRYVAQGLGIGVGVKGGRPRILVNLEASKLEGAELGAELLKLADILP
ncbi:MAG: YfiR/HmsC family protein [Gemmatimonadota bacterium]